MHRTKYRANHRMTRLAKFLHIKAFRLLVAAAVLVSGLALSWFEPPVVLELHEVIWDQMVRLKPRPYDPVLNVRIIDIDERSLAEYGQWPWPRARMARLVDALAGYGVRAAAFDVIFAEPDRTSISNIFEVLKDDVPGFVPPLSGAQIKNLPDNDALFAASMQRLPIVLALSVETKRSASSAREFFNLPRFKFERSKDQYYLQEFPSAVAALPVLQKNAAANAAIDIKTDPDGISRRLPLLLKADKRRIVALAPALVQVATGAELTAQSNRPGLKSVTLGETVIPTDRNGQMRLYDSSRQSFRTISAADVLTGQADAKKLENALVIIGPGAEGLYDLKLTPIDRWVPGMELHAQFTEQILSGSFLSRPVWGRTFETAFLAGCGLLLLGFAYAGWNKCPAWLVAVVGSAAITATVWLAFANYRMLLDPVIPSVFLLAAAAGDRFMLVLDLRRERSAVRGAFSRYLAPAVVEQLARHPDRLALGGERREMTFLFCDIRGFTSISEQFEGDPEALTTLINNFLTPMTDEILARHGTIDKYMGDCIMAFWNAPVDDPYHAAHACESALAMRAALTDLNERLRKVAESVAWPFTIKIGIGLNTGNCVVGNMGSEQRFDYSVLGDPVNLASRLEGQSKTYGVDILIGENTRAAAPDFAALEVDLIAVRGRSAPARVYTLLGHMALRDSETYQRLQSAHAAMLDAYRARDWNGAQTYLETCRGFALPEWNLSSLYKLYAERIEEFAENPPPKDWYGVYTALSK